jgi:sugar phosphate isomerase/epimerase/predicted MFS family arabinose efflux permease
MFGSLWVRNYRFYASGQVVSLVGVWMQRVAQDWLVLELSHGSPVALGIAAALQFAPTLLLSLWAGVLADRMDKRRLLLVLETGLGLCALALGLLDVTGLVQLWQVYLLCLMLGAVSAVETPVRQSFVVEMVGRDQLTNAVALNSMTFNLARMVGPAIAGVMITAIGTGWVFLANAASFVGVIGGLLLMNPRELYRSDPVPARRGQLVEGLRYVRGRLDIVIVLVIVFFVSTFGLNFFVTLAIVARNVFHGQADAYGFLSTLLAVGTLSGATLAARHSSRGRPGPKLLIISALAFGALETVSGLMPTLLTVGLVLIPTGIAAMTFMTTANSAVQLAVSPAMRGRVMGLYMLVFLGANPVGGPLMGWLAANFTGRSPLVVGGVVVVYAGGEANKDLLAYQVQTGELAWGAPVGQGSYSSPQLMMIGGEPQVLFLADRGLTAVGTFVFDDFHDPDRTREVIAATRRACRAIVGAGGAVLVLIDRPGPERAATAGRPSAARRLRGRAWAAMVDAIRRAAAIADDHGLRPAFHPHAGSFVEFEDEIERLLDAGAVGLCLDTGHAAYVGIGPERAVVAYASRLIHVHLKDVRRDVVARRLDFWSAIGAGVFCPLGEGAVDLPAVVGALDAVGYHGYATVEQDRVAGRGSPSEDLAASLRALAGAGAVR